MREPARVLERTPVTRCATHEFSLCGHQPAWFRGRIYVRHTTSYCLLSPGSLRPRSFPKHHKTDRVDRCVDLSGTLRGSREVSDKVVICGVAELGTDRFGPDLIEPVQGPRGELVVVITGPPRSYLDRVAIRWNPHHDFGSGTKPWFREGTLVGRHEFER